MNRKLREKQLRNRIDDENRRLAREHEELFGLIKAMRNRYNSFEVIIKSARERELEIQNRNLKRILSGYKINLDGVSEGTDETTSPIRDDGVLAVSDETTESSQFLKNEKEPGEV